MSQSFRKSGKSREIFKFSLYIMAPIGCAAIYSNPELMKKLILKYDYVHYPPAKIMPPEEIKKQMDYNRQMLKEMRAEEVELNAVARKELEKSK